MKFQFLWAEKRISERDIVDTKDRESFLDRERRSLGEQIAEKVKDHIEYELINKVWEEWQLLKWSIFVWDREFLDSTIEKLEEAKCIMQKFLHKCQTGRARSRETCWEMMSWLTSIWWGVEKVCQCDPMYPSCRDPSDPDHFKPDPCDSPVCVHR